MRILSVATGSYGDVYPLIGLSRTLARRGHEVLFFANEYFRKSAEDEGLPFVAAGTAEDYMRIVQDPRVWHPRRGIELLMEAIMRFTPAGYDLLGQHIRPDQTILVATSTSFPARLIQETHGVPLATVHLAPGVFRSADDAIHLPLFSIPERAPGWLKSLFWGFADRYVFDPMIAPLLNRYRATLNLSPVRRVFAEWIHSPDCVIGMFPDWFATPRPDWPAATLLTGFPLYDAALHEPLPDDLESFLSAGPPPVLFAPGTANIAAEGFFSVSLEACRLAGRRALFVTRFAGQIPNPMPDWARHFDYLPFSSVLNRCSAFVHHGGIGSLSQGFRAGVPQLIRPMGFDQFDNGRRAANLKVARVIGVRRYRAGKVAQTLDELSADSIRLACRKLVSRFGNTDPLDLAANCVEACMRYSRR